MQSTHAVVQYGKEYPESFHTWYEQSNYLGSLSVKNEEELLSLLDKCRSNGLKTSAFYEPDVNQITSIAIEPCELARKLVSSIPRALKQYDDPSVLINKHTVQ